MRGTQYAFANSARLQAQLKKRNIAYRHILELAPDIALIKQLHADFSHLPMRQRDRLSEGYIQTYTEKYLKDFNARVFVESLGMSKPLRFFVWKLPRKPVIGALLQTTWKPTLAFAYGTYNRKLSLLYKAVQFISYIQASDNDLLPS